MENKILEIAKDFFNHLQIKIDKINIEKEKDRIYKMIIQTEESWVLIWFSWQTLESIRRILKIIISNITWEKISLHIEINDYIKEKDKKLYSFIQKKIDYLLESKNEIRLPYFSPYERKKIHNYVNEQKNEHIYTSSKWEWKERRMYIWFKKESITIDLDNLDI